jgi:hypothetical protein
LKTLPNFLFKIYVQTKFHKKARRAFITISGILAFSVQNVLKLLFQEINQVLFDANKMKYKVRQT